MANFMTVTMRINSNWFGEATSNDFHPAKNKSGTVQVGAIYVGSGDKTGSSLMLYGVGFDDYIFKPDDISHMKCINNNVPVKYNGKVIPGGSKYQVIFKDGKKAFLNIAAKYVDRIENLFADLLCSIDPIPMANSAIATQTQANVPAPTQTMDFDYRIKSATLLKSMKDLLDCGAISQEEFDKSKEELLSPIKNASEKSAPQNVEAVTENNAKQPNQETEAPLSETVDSAEASSISTSQPEPVVVNEITEDLKNITHQEIKAELQQTDEKNVPFWYKVVNSVFEVLLIAFSCLLLLYCLPECIENESRLTLEYVSAFDMGYPILIQSCIFLSIISIFATIIISAWNLTHWNKRKYTVRNIATLCACALTSLTGFFVSEFEYISMTGFFVIIFIIAMLELSKDLS